MLLIRETPYLPQTLRPYQQDAVAAVRKAWDASERAPLIAVATGGGKTTIIVPPLEDNLYRLVHVPREKDKTMKTLNRNEDLASLMIEADAHVKKVAGSVANKNASWRSEPATTAQLGLLHQLGVQTSTDISRGAASQMITHALAVRRLTAE